MRLSINLPALERLLAGDSELEVQLRQQVVENFAKKHLKTILNDETWKKASAAWQAELDSAVKKHLEEFSNEKEENADDLYTVRSVRWKFDDLVKKAVQASLDNAVEDRIEKYKAYWSRYIKEAVEKAMDQEIAQEVEKEIQRRLAAAAETSRGHAERSET